MYESFFHLKSRPFSAAPTVDSFFPAETIEQSRQTAIRAIERAEGPVLVIGPPGVGKSSLCRLLATYFESAFDVVVLSNSRIETRKALLQNILFELRLPYRGLDEGELRLSLMDHLNPSEDCPHGLLLIIDEMHTLPMRLLEELRMITNLVRDGQPRVRLVLAGGPRLDERFANPRLESFNQRVAARCYLQAIGREESDNYIRAQIAKVGGAADTIFTDDGFRAVYQATDGIPRLINQICNHALTMACEAGSRTLDASRVEEAWADLQQLPTPWNEPTVEADAGNAFIEFGDLDTDEPSSDEPEPAPAVIESAGDVDETAPEEVSETTELVIGDAPGATILEFGPCDTETQTDADITVAAAEPLEEAAPEPEPEPEPDPEPEPETTAPKAENPFDVVYDEEEVIVDLNSAASLERAVIPIRAAEIETNEELDAAPVTTETPEVTADENPAESIECETVDDTPAPTVEDQVEELIAEVPAVAELEAEQPAEADISQVFEYTVFEQTNEEQITFDTSGVIPALVTEWDAGPQGEIVQCVAVQSDSPPIEDDRDLIEVEAEEAQTTPPPAAEDTQARRMDYKDLFAQLRRVE